MYIKERRGVIGGLLRSVTHTARALCARVPDVQASHEVHVHQVNIAAPAPPRCFPLAPLAVFLALARLNGTLLSVGFALVSLEKPKIKTKKAPTSPSP